MADGSREANVEAQLEELEVLRSIYDDAVVEIRGEGPGSGDRTSLVVRVREGSMPVTLEVTLPTGTYPAAAAGEGAATCPAFAINARWMPAERVGELTRGLKGLHADADGEVVLFSWVEYLRSALADDDAAGDDDHTDGDAHDSGAGAGTAADGTESAHHAGASEAAGGGGGAVREASGGTAASTADGASGDGGDGGSYEYSWTPGSGTGPTAPSAPDVPTILSGEPMVDRKSVFQAHVASVTTAAQVRAVIEALLTDRKIARATHNMWAYRIAVHEGDADGTGNSGGGGGGGGESAPTRYLKDNDDDGESAAGSRLAHLLELMDVRAAVVVVSRWYGGIQLGPDRFKHINNVAREMLERAGLGGRDTAGGAGGSSGAGGGKGKGGKKGRRK